MALGDTRDTKCVRCGRPLVKGFLSQALKLCCECIELKRQERRDRVLAESLVASFSAPAKNDDGKVVDDEKEAPAAAERAPFPEPQPRTESAAGDKNEEAPAEEKPAPEKGSKRKRGIRASAAKNPEAKKLTPACADCKKSKKRCTHRRPVDATSSDMPPRKRKRGHEKEAEAEAQVGGDDKEDAANNDNNDNGAAAAAAAPAKKARRIRWQDNNSEGGILPESQPAAAQVGSSAMPASPKEQQTRGGMMTCKRKLAEIQEKESLVDSSANKNAAAAATSDAGIGTVEESPRKRTRRVKKPNADQRVEVVIQTTSGGAAPAPASNATDASAPAAPGQRVFLPFPLDSNNLEGSAIMSRHASLSRELQAKIDDARVKWEAAMEALEAAKRHLDMWLELWKTGQ
ncbi:hypothetical protein M432DRAFT_649755 [Thermoascus aurantiacus ATCC 26904]